ncbi:pyrimidine 5'-nucleotidase [Sphaerotilus microaerophilus]|uniref:Pyrimidine 5'-nucleotidase n=1 Tax=Sphaerotilus microaerophilus TaxID=2914710 RepID=A0ABM7YIX4_9BURK|nr:pyrimidine 5'-nucleotidase [Sphaerotilus sp. FB-5]BDI04246.1 pyrimidine 5'-nucleotidase [Sphaerotilus sp. FB-5]
MSGDRAARSSRSGRPVWLFDLDNTLHDASHAAFGMIDRSMNDYIERELAVSAEEANRLRGHYWHRYGATLLGLMRHHGVKAPHFLHHTHVLPGLESRLRAHAHDLAALARLPGAKFILTNAPLAYAERVLGALGMARLFNGVIAIDQMRMFGQLRPKPDVRMLRRVAVQLRVPPGRCVLVEDTLGHQKAARRVGMGTVWMQRWLRRNAHGPEVGVRLHRRPVYVCDRIRSLQALTRSVVLRRCG